MVARTANLRTRLTGIPYGDQGIFVRRKTFEKIEGYPNIQLMEDLEFGRRMKREGKLALLAESIRTSPRRWNREGIWVTIMRNQIFVLLYFLGISPARLALWYRPVR